MNSYGASIVLSSCDRLKSRLQRDRLHGVNHLLP
jgi:hypothetical protein